MNKERLGDCCGARIIYGMDQAAFRYGLFETPSEGLLKSIVTEDSPGVSVVVIASYQRRRWHKPLLRAGFQVAADNINNRNTGRRLYVYIRIDRDASRKSWSVNDAEVPPLIKAVGRKPKAKEVV